VKAASPKKARGWAIARDDIDNRASP